MKKAHIYRGRHAREISFPLGGIGSGSIGLDGSGRLIDWEIFNRPNKGGVNGHSHIAVQVRTGDGVYTRVLNGDILKDFCGQRRGTKEAGYGFGHKAESMGGFPHFRNVSFDGRFPIAELHFSDPDFPATVDLTAFNPFIPLDSENSSLPAAFFSIAVHNPTDAPMECRIAFSVCNPFENALNRTARDGDCRELILREATFGEDDVRYGDLTLATDCKKTEVQTYWYRGWWLDSVVAFWKDFSADGTLSDRVYENAGKWDAGTLVADVEIPARESGRARFVLAWNVPNCTNDWDQAWLETKPADNRWKNYYATRFADSTATARYALSNWDSLWERTAKFRDALFASDLPDEMMDAVSANLSVLKSPVVKRLEDGAFYGWEGVAEGFGVCEGTCQHVWNYAYALCFLFPDLERSIREQEIHVSTLPSGKSVFRLYLPRSRDQDRFRACLDGSMGVIFKCYREWKICGDDAWLSSVWETLKRIIGYAWSEENPDRWDRDRDGVLEGRQHHTLDMELFGPSSWLEGMYIVALTAMGEMAEHFGEYEAAEDYRRLAAKGKEYLRTELFNGEYFVQKIDLTDRERVLSYDAENYWNDERGQIKYQIGEGCLLDQMLGQWHAELLGLGDIFDPAEVDTALGSLMKYNYHSTFRDFINPWRLFAIDDEAGTVICSFPEGVEQPAIPIPYAQECMTGFEYAFAGLLLAKGHEKDALRVVKAVRDRYDGEKRNPWNEIECGSNYARSMASFALLPIMSGFTFDMPRHKIGFSPLGGKRRFTAFWSLGSAWGLYRKTDKTIRLTVTEGKIALSAFGLPKGACAKRLTIDGKPLPFAQDGDTITFALTDVGRELTVSI